MNKLINWCSNDQGLDRVQTEPIFIHNSLLKVTDIPVIINQVNLESINPMKTKHIP